MSTHRRIDLICVVVVIIGLLLTILFMNGEALGLQTASRSMGYETTLFDTSRVHTIDIEIDDWDAFLSTCESETYSVCTVVIDNEAVKNVGIRGKGNTSLSTVKTLGSERYSFKIEFDQYEDGKNYHGLDKLSLNNIIQDNTYMKDYLSYRLMAEFGVDTPLCSFVYITVNGEDWGLYLAVEGVEDSFLQRNYGRDTGELYKPDSMSFGGGGPGNGRDFNMDDFLKRDSESDASEEGSGTADTGGTQPDGFDPSQFTRESGSQGSFGFPGGNMPEGFDPSQFTGESGGQGGFGFPGGNMPEGFDPSQFTSESGDSDGASDSRRERGGFSFDFGGIFGGMGSSDVKLQYADDDPDSYSNIFSNAKTDVSKADQTRLIESLKKLNSYEDIESVVDVDEVIRYFVVHNFVCNGDSYTGSIVHNYYLHVSDGQLCMIPWDYTLAFGTFQNSDATGTVNDPIDSPMSVSDADERPMWGWIMSSEEYTQMYHEYFAEFLDTVDITGIIDEAYELIKSYVAKDPTAFCTYEEFETGVATLRSFCEMRIRSVRGQLDGTIPSTDAGQRADFSALIDASSITISDMGSMGGSGGGGGGFGGFSGRGSDSSGDKAENSGGGESSDGDSGSGFGGGFGGSGFGGGPSGQSGSGGSAFPGGSMSEGFDPSQFTGGQGGSGFPGRGSDASGGGQGFGGSGFPGGGMQRPDASGSDGTEPSGGSGNAGAPSGSGQMSPPDMGSFGGGFGPGGTGATIAWGTLAITAAVLIGGLALAFCYRRRS